MEKLKRDIIEGNCSLGVEFGSTRIKAVMLDEELNVVATGIYCWENRLENNVWTYTLEDILNGIKGCYLSVKNDVFQKYGVILKKISAIGISAMMHGYMPFDKKMKLLTPFRTWRNTMTAKAQQILTKEFNYPVPQRFSIAHLYQAILNDEEHIKDIAFFTTLSGYVHFLLTGEKVLGIGDASGMFPIDISSKNYNQAMIKKFDKLVENKKTHFSIKDILPKVKLAGEICGYLTDAGAKLLDDSGDLISGTPFCAPEGDAGTGMVATNTIKKRTGNISAGTSIFAMVVLENELKSAYEEIDLVTTPQGDLVAMAHCNNCASDLNAWINIFKEYNQLFDIKIGDNEIYEKLFHHSLKGDDDCGEMLAYNYYSGEQITKLDEGRPVFIRKPNSKFNLANFIKVNIYSCFATLRLGMDILLEKEKVKIDSLLAHGGIFKTKDVGQKALAAALNLPISVTNTAGEGGAYGIALLSSYILKTKEFEKLEDYLDKKVFVNNKIFKIEPKKNEVIGFEKFILRYKKCINLEIEAVKNFN